MTPRALLKCPVLIVQQGSALSKQETLEVALLGTFFLPAAGWLIILLESSSQG